jgi:hypothetical protein
MQDFRFDTSDEVESNRYGAITDNGAQPDFGLSLFDATRPKDMRNSCHKYEGQKSGRSKTCQQVLQDKVTVVKNYLSSAVLNLVHEAKLDSGDLDRCQLVAKEGLLG